MSIERMIVMNNRRNMQQIVSTVSVPVGTQGESQTDMQNCPNYRMLAKDVYVSNDTHRTKLNNNDCVCGSSGRGKTTGYVSPLISQMCGSMIIADTKNALYEQHHAELEAGGYRVLRLDLLQGEDTCCYNPLDYVRYDKETDHYNEKDIIALAEMLCPLDMDRKEPFWPQSAQMLLSALIAYILEAVDYEEHTMDSVLLLFEAGCVKGNLDKIFAEHEAAFPDSFAARRYKRFCVVTQAEKCYSSIMMFVANAINGFDCAETRGIFRKTDLDFARIGQERTAVFVNVSDTDRSVDRIVNIFYAHAFHKLIEFADHQPEKQLPVEVRFILDDFATNTVIPNFSQIISVIRSRRICVSIILQNISQLRELYSEAAADTIISNCDHMLFLGTTEVNTAKFVGEKMNVPFYTILNLPIEDAYLFESGSTKGGIRVAKYRPAYFDSDTGKEPQS